MKKKLETKLNKENILKILEELPEEIKTSDFIILSGAAMVLRNLKKDTSDIDLAINESTYLKIKDNYQSIIGAYGLSISQLGLVQFSNNLYTKEYDLICGYKVAPPEYILKIKKELNRKSDKKDIGILEVYLAQKDKYQYERNLYQEGFNLVAGVDEVGRGPLVGPVVAACVILPKNCDIKDLNDSKKLSEKKREELYPKIIEQAISYGIGIIDAKTIDKVNIYEASKLAMKQAIENMKIKPEYILVDALELDIAIPNKGIIHGDAISANIAAASIIAKVTRDHMMDELDIKYPMYGFKNHKGYPTKEHLEALEKYGPLDNYRFSYGPVKKYQSRSEEVVNNEKIMAK